MRHLVSLPVLSIALCWATSACIAPEYPDDFDELDNAVGMGPDASFSPDAFVPPALDPSGLLQDAAIRPTPDAGSRLWPSVDAGAVVQPLDSGFTPFPRGGSGASGDAGAVADAGSAPQVDAGGAASGNGATRCTVSASTDASSAFRYAGKYGCAVWISDASSKVLKAFLVATRIASRSGLSTYSRQSSGVSVDVTTGATLSSARQHNYTWDLAGVTPGPYTLNVETHSSNGDVVVSVPFDTSMAPVSESGAARGDIKSASISCD